MAINLRNNNKSQPCQNLLKPPDNRILYICRFFLFHNSHTVIDDERGREGQYVGDGHERNKLRQVHEEFWSHPGELMNEGSCHGFHGL